MEVWQALIEATSGDSAVEAGRKKADSSTVLLLFYLFKLKSSPVRYYPTLFGIRVKSTIFL